MRSIDAIAFGFAILSLLSFVSSSNSFQFRQTWLGTGKLLLGTVTLLAGVAAGVVSIGTDGYEPLTAEPSVVAIALVTALPGDSLTARVTWPDGVTRTFRLEGVRTRFEVRTLRWRFGGTLLGSDEAWEFSGLTAQNRQGQTPPGSIRNLQRERPVTLYDLVLRYPALTALVEPAELSADVAPGSNGVVLRISSDGLTVGN